jgi:hypothetical protein
MRMPNVVERTHMTPTFEALCAGLSKLLQAAAPEVRVDQHGLAALTIESERAVVTIAQHRDTPEHLMVISNIGPVDQDNEVRMLRAVLDANFLLLGPGSPTFSRNSETGNVLLQYCCPIASCTPESVSTTIGHFAELARRWETGFFDFAAADQRPGLANITSKA